jgi:hypothetical protein
MHLFLAVAAIAAGAFGRDLESIRCDLAVPQVSAVILDHGRIVWSRERDRKYPIASITKSLSAVAAMQLVEEGKIALNDPVDDADVPPGTTVANYLSHTSDGPYFLYSGARYARLGSLIARAAGMPLEEVLQKTFARAGMTDSAAPPGVSTAGGVISTARDLARFDIALDGDCLISPASRRRLFTPRARADGSPLPYALGFFSERVSGEEVIWGYGQESNASALYLKLPARKLTLIVLANSIAFSDPFWLLFGEVRRSPIALAFLRHAGVEVSSDDEAIARAMLLASIGRKNESNALLRSAIGDQADAALLAAVARSGDKALRAKGEAIAAELLRRDSDHPRLLFDLAILRLQDGREAEAAPLFEHVAKQKNLSTKAIVAISAQHAVHNAPP